jgi:hypothetical protein
MTFLCVSPNLSDQRHIAHKDFRACRSARQAEWVSDRGQRVEFLLVTPS